MSGLLLIVILLALTPRSELPRLLDEAERIRQSDKPRSRALLDDVERTLAADPDPQLIARAQLLECNSDAPDAAYRAVAIGLDAATKAVSSAGYARYVRGAMADDESLYQAKTGGRNSSPRPPARRAK